MIRKLFFVSALFFSAILITHYWNLLSPPSIETPQTNKQATAIQPPSKPDSKKSVRTTQAASRRIPSSKEYFSESEWSAFQEKFGHHLIPKLYENKRLTSVRGRFGEGYFADTALDMKNPQHAIRRASEILTAAKPMMGVQETLPFENPIAKVGKISTQVYYKQTYDSYPIEPKGDVKINLGPQGELISFSTDFLPQIEIDNDFKLNADFILQELDRLGFSKPKGGRKLIWVAHGKGRKAYEFYSKGEQIIVDGENAQILYRRDRKHFYSSSSWSS